MYTKVILSILASLLSVSADSLTLTVDPTSTVTHNPCNTPLTPHDTEDSWYNPCPNYFHPLPSQGALSGQYFTLFGFPALNGFSGSIITADDKSTTYAMTCLDTDVVGFVGGQCSETGHVVPITASGWEWHMTTSSIDTYDGTTVFESMTLSINPSGHIDYTYIESESSSRTRTYSYSVSTSVYRTTHTWTGTVDLADPSIVPIVGLDKIGGSDTPFPTSTSRVKASSGSSSRNASSGSASKSASNASITPAPSQSLADASSSTSRASGAAARLSPTRSFLLGDWVWMMLATSSILVASLAVLL